jgi:hypothetical protein
MAVGVDHILLGEDAVGDHEVLDDGVDVAHVVMTRTDVCLYRIARSPDGAQRNPGRLSRISLRSMRLRLTSPCDR